MVGSPLYPATIGHRTISTIIAQIMRHARMQYIRPLTCQVPNANLPPATGTVRLAPISELCAYVGVVCGATVNQMKGMLEDCSNTGVQNTRQMESSRNAAFIAVVGDCSKQKAKYAENADSQD